MQGEFDTAIEEGEPFAFAAGCLIAAWRELPKHEEGRLTLANYALALGLLIPMAVFQLGRAIGFSAIFITQNGLLGTTAAGVSQDPYLNYAQIGAAPALLLLWLLLGISHLCLAWVLVERDWSRVVQIGALIAAATVTLLSFMGVLFLDLSSLLLQAAALTIELTAILAAARWHARLFTNASLDVPAW